MHSFMILNLRDGHFKALGRVISLVMLWDANILFMWVWMFDSFIAVFDVVETMVDSNRLAMKKVTSAEIYSKRGEFTGKIMDGQRGRMSWFNEDHSGGSRQFISSLCQFNRECSRFIKNAGGYQRLLTLELNP
jgi:hypothetical protein